MNTLKNTRQFSRVYKRGKSVKNYNLVVYYLKNNENKINLGISISKKVGNAVIRNRVRRLIKENFRLHMDKIKNGYDIVVIGRVRSNSSSFKDIEKSLLYCLKKGRLLNEKNNDQTH